jgi:hypothetical protein
MIYIQEPFESIAGFERAYAMGMTFGQHKSPLPVKLPRMPGRPNDG